MFAGITALAVVTQVHMAEDTSRLVGFPAGSDQRTALSQIGLAVFGSGPAVLSAAGLHRRDPRPGREHRLQRLPRAGLVAGPGRVPAPSARPGAATDWCSATASCCSRGSPGLLIVAFDADVTRLIQLYIIGVFVSFTLSQAGMVRHWSRELRARVRRPGPPEDPPLAGAQRHGCSGHCCRPDLGPGDEVRSRSMDRRHRHAAALRPDAAHPAALRHGRRRGRPAPGRNHAAEPHPRRGPRGEDATNPRCAPSPSPGQPDPDDLSAVTVRVDPSETDELFSRVGRAATSRCP